MTQAACDFSLVVAGAAAKAPGEPCRSYIYWTESLWCVACMRALLLSILAKERTVTGSDVWLTRKGSLVS